MGARMNPGESVLSIRMRRHIVDADFQVSLDHPGVTVLFGPSGSGKSTILRCVAGLDRISTGRLTLGADVLDDGERQHVRAQDRGIGYMFQELALFPHLDVAQNVGYGLHAVPRPERALRVQEALRSAGATGFENRKIRELSGGEAQRVALARTLAPRPRLLLLDEPLSALDAPTRLSLRTELRQLILNAGIPAIIVTHDRDEALSLADRLVVLIDGSVRQIGTPADVFEHPADRDVARAVGMENTVPGTIVGSTPGGARIRSGRTELLASLDTVPGQRTAGRDVVICIRAGDVGIEVAPPEARGGSMTNRIASSVTAVTEESSIVRIDLDAGFPLICFVTRRDHALTGFHVGMPVTSVIAPSALHLVHP
ncbi:MAG TPA: ABC transporter ATP-binding protein [Cryobacterium sp.]|nr:ABC transporter ATP-binding protein [Cryobacterium sp.]